MKPYNNLSTREFDNFIRYAGLLTEDWRSDLVQALQQYFSQEAPNSILDNFSDSSWQSKYPQWKQVLTRLHQENTFRKLVAKYPILLSKTMQEILNWFKKSSRNLQKSNPYFEEQLDHQQLVDKLNQKSWQDLESWQNLIKKLKTIYPHHTQKLWDFYSTQYQKLYDNLNQKRQKTKEQSKEIPPLNSEEKAQLNQEIQALQRKLAEDWENLLWEKTVKDEQDKLESSLTDFLLLLNERYLKLENLYKKLQPFFQYFGRSWDLSQGVWQNISWDELERYAKMLENEKSLQELAELLGKFANAENEYELEVLQKTVIEYKWQADHSSKSEIIGTHYSDDISNILPSELSMLTSPITETLFAKNFVEKKLLTWEYKGQTWAKTETISFETTPKAKEDKKGPIIICVDTSGSMAGTPEHVAKTITLALTNIATRDQRKCYLISFSNQIATLDLSDIDQSLGKLVQFLGMGFYGGTDAFPPLQEALKMLNTSNYQKADVLMVSDFIVPELPESLTTAIAQQQKDKKTHFHSLTISEQGNLEAMKVFDTNWCYHLSSPKAMSSTIEKMNKIFTK